MLAFDKDANCAGGDGRRVVSVINCHPVIDALLASGVIRAEDNVTRVVIDIKVGDLPVIYVERFADNRLLEVIPSLTGVEIRGASPRSTVPAAAPSGKPQHVVHLGPLGLSVADVPPDDDAKTPDVFARAIAAGLATKHPAVARCEELLLEAMERGPASQATITPGELMKALYPVSGEASSTEGANGASAA